MILEYLSFQPGKPNVIRLPSLPMMPFTAKLFCGEEKTECVFKKLLKIVLSEEAVTVRYCGREVLLKGRLSTVNLLIVTNLDQHFLIIIFFLFYKISYLNEEVNCTEPSPSVRVP